MEVLAAIGLEQVVLIICMDNKNSMRKRKFDYYMNALHYCLYKGEVWSNYKVERQVYGLIGFLSTILGLRKYWVKRVEKLHNDKELQEYLYGKEWGQSISLAHHWFGFFYSGYSLFLSFVLLGIPDGLYGGVNEIIALVIIALPIGLCYIPAYRAVFSKDRYLKYFKQFEKEDEQWHKKWKWITIAFCIGSILFAIGGMYAMWGVSLFFRE